MVVLVSGVAWMACMACSSYKCRGRPRRANCARTRERLRRTYAPSLKGWRRRKRQCLIYSLGSSPSSSLLSCLSSSLIRFFSSPSISISISSSSSKFRWMLSYQKTSYIYTRCCLICFTVMWCLVSRLLQLMCLADLEFDYINPYDLSARINKVVLPEFVTQAVQCFFYLVTRHWIMALLCAPYLLHNIRM